MPFFPWSNTIFIIVLACSFHSETSSEMNNRVPPNCMLYGSHLHACSREMDPVCATNGQTYSNKCTFCSEKIESGDKIKFSHFGRC